LNDVSTEFLEQLAAVMEIRNAASEAMLQIRELSRASAKAAQAARLADRFYEDMKKLFPLSFLDQPNKSDYNFLAEAIEEV
jgi:hypothetical protein